MVAVQAYTTGKGWRKVFSLLVLSTPIKVHVNVCKACFLQAIYQSLIQYTFAVVTTQQTVIQTMSDSINTSVYM